MLSWLHQLWHLKGNECCCLHVGPPTPLSINDDDNGRCWNKTKVCPRKCWWNCEFGQQVAQSRLVNTTITASAAVCYLTDQYFRNKSLYSVHFNGHFPREPGLSDWYQNVSILESVRAKGDGGGGNNWSYETPKAPVKSSPTNQHPVL